jgi:ATP-dependent RNA helicase DeaD
MSQRERDNVMGRFRQGTVETLVATDVAARGLDVNHVTHVFNFDIPQDSDTYVHRIGRTGRAGRHGIAITLVTPREAKQLKFIEKDIKKQIKRHPLPTLAEVIEKRQQQLVNSIVSELDSPLGDFKPAALQLLENYDSESLLAAALKIIAQNDKSIEMTELEDAHPDKVTIQVPFGRIHGLRAKSLVDLIVSNTVLRPKEVGDIQVFDTVSNVEVPAKLADQVYASLINMKAPKKGGRGKGNERGTAGPARGAGKDRGAKERNAGKERAAGKGGSPAKTRKAKVRSAY